MSPPTSRTPTMPPVMAGMLAPVGSGLGAATAGVVVGAGVGSGGVEGWFAEGLGGEVPSSGGTSAVRALTTLRIPNPHLLSLPGAPMSVAVAVNRCITSCAESFGNLARTKAAAPETSAVASEVPCPFQYLSLGRALVMLAPGAQICTFSFAKEKLAGLPASVDAPTARTPGIAAGYPDKTSCRLLPAAATTRTSFRAASSTAACSD